MSLHRRAKVQPSAIPASKFGRRSTSGAPAEGAGSLDWADLAALESRLEQFLAIGVNAAGYPIARPSDCRAVTLAFDATFERHLRSFETGHQETIDRFFALIERFKGSALGGYSAELARVEFLEARVLATIGDHEGAAAKIALWGERPYRIDGDVRLIMEAFDLDLTARLVAGRIEEVRRLAMSRVLFLAAGGRTRAFGLTRLFYPALSLGGAGDGRRHWAQPVLRAASLLCVWESEIGSRRPWSRLFRWLVMTLGLVVADSALFVAALLPIRDLVLQSQSVPAASPPPLRGAPGDQAPAILVTRPTGGLGDLLMMTPGLRALARRHGRPVAFAIPRRFHHAFAEDPDFQILDCDAFIDLARFRRWRNLGLCPAARYESRHAPRIKLGRVELFARGMGVKRRELLASGQAPHIAPDKASRTTVADIRGRADSAGRPLIGVALHSREAYRDYPRMPELLSALAERYTVLAIHTTQVALPESAHIIGWFDKSLELTVAAIAACDAVVSVDTALYHFAGALNVPAVAVFGPTSAKVRSVHIPRAITVEAEGFPCRPCWRNEDERCQMSGTFDSVCMSSLGVDRILAGLERLAPFGDRQGRRSERHHGDSASETACL